MSSIVIAFAYGMFVMEFWRYALDGRAPKIRDWATVIFLGWYIVPLAIIMFVMTLIFDCVIASFKWLKKKW